MDDSFNAIYDLFLLNVFRVLGAIYHACRCPFERYSPKPCELRSWADNNSANLWAASSKSIRE